MATHSLQVIDPFCLIMSLSAISKGRVIMSDDVWRRLEAFVDVEWGRPRRLLGGRHELGPSTSLERDLGLTGIDAYDFIDEWAERFGVDVDTFPYGRYIGQEGVDPLTPLLGLVWKRFRRPPLVPLTLGMLAEAVHLGRWDTDLIEQATLERAL
jgi:hypothetical protein